MLKIVDADDLVDPADEGRHLDIDTRHVGPAAAESPGHQAGQLVEAVYQAHHGPATVALAGVVALLPSGAVRAGRHQELLLGHRVDLGRAVAVLDDGQHRFTNPQRDGTAFSQVAVSSDGAPVTRRRGRSAGGQADEAYARVELDGALELEERDVVVQRLPVVVVVDVGGGHTARLRARVRALATEVVVADAHEHRLAVAHQAGDAVRCSENPLRTDQCTSA